MRVGTIAAAGLSLMLSGGCYLGVGADGQDTAGGGTDGISASGGPGSGPGSDSDSDGETEGDSESESDSDGPGDPPEAGEGDSRFPRLSHQQWENSVRDLLGLDQPTGLSDNFVSDPLSGTFDNQGASFEVSDNLWGDYQRASESVADLVVNDAATLERISPADIGQGVDARGREFIETFGLKVFRRPLTTAEVDSLASAFSGAAANYPDLEPFAAGVHLSLQTLLQSPYFLYRVVEGEAGPTGKVTLSGFERASRMSYALWNSMPDDLLFEAADSGRLDTKDGVVAEVDRMLDSPKAAEMVADLHRQLLKMDLYRDKFRDPDFYPGFDPAVGAAMETEAQMFIKDVVLDRNLGYAELLTETQTYVNAELAPYYGLDPAQFTDEFVPVTLDATQRSGLLTRLGFLMSRSYQVDPDPIHRGAFISFELLCNEQPPVPDDVTAVEADPTKSNRQRIEDHTGVGTCGAGCHLPLINGFGFAFENYDAVGTWRDEDFGHPVDAAAEMGFDGGLQQFDNAIELSQMLADSPQAHACYSRHLLEYFHARRHRERDEEALDEIGTLSAEGEISVREVIAELVTSDDFLSIRIEVEGE